MSEEPFGVQYWRQCSTYVVSNELLFSPTVTRYHTSVNEEWNNYPDKHANIDLHLMNPHCGHGCCNLHIMVVRPRALKSVLT